MHAQMKLLSMDQKTSVAGVLRIDGGSNKHHKIPKMLQSSMLASGAAGISIFQARRRVNDMRRGSHENYMEDLCKLPALIKAFQNADPGGKYILDTKPLSYDVIGAPEGAREYVGMTLIPSAGMKYWKKSDMKAVACDMAHNYDQYPGFTGVAVAQDGYAHVTNEGNVS